ncbi:phytoene desaturase family protein [Halococcoides cellulosivorans]|uniref:Phytoene desaturase n=1 Tax=Halococcoides cellulosivorans TaxID=1679096 RepID=A0A2R4WZS2_9EURY|nr:phytoene desaturase family protein [Halococcoides cellulosivorans]AWB27030.1 phytoene desaturase [Halococcoides cellulosivorans]
MSQTRDRSAVVVGGGFGGLSAACYLADAGVEVTLLEKNDQVGGRASRLDREGFVFDMGPSWYMMPGVYERFFAAFGREPTDYYTLDQLDPNYRVFFTDGDRLELRPDRAANHALFESYEDGAGDALDAYLDTAKQHYEQSMESIIYVDRPTWRDWLDPELMGTLSLGLQLFRSMDSYVESTFEHQKLRQIMQYTLTFLGVAPSRAPAIYSMISHVDFDLGVYYPQPVDGGPGGIGAVVDAVTDLAGELGVTIETDQEVTAIDTEGGLTVQTADRSVAADAVVVNADYAHVERELLDPADRQYDEAYWESRTYAPSSYVLYLGVEGATPELAHHTLIMPTDWDDHFEALFDDPAWPEEPAYYLCVPSKSDDSVAPEGHSNLFALVPIAAGLDDTPEIREQYREMILDDIATHADIDLRDRIVVEEDFCLSEFTERYNATQGTAMGLAHTRRQTGPLRPDNRSSAVEDLYYAGGYTTPGVGVPMCLISGEHAAQAALDRWR